MKTRISPAMKIIGYILLIAMGIGQLILFYKNNLLLTLLLIIELGIILKTDYKKGDLNYVLTAAVIGPLGESVTVHFKIWTYSYPSFLKIPLWLPIAWGSVVLVIKRINDELEKLTQK